MPPAQSAIPDDRNRGRASTAASSGPTASGLPKGAWAPAVSVWHRRWKASGTDGLRSKGPSGPAPRLCDQQLAEVEQALLKGPTASGFVGELWTPHLASWFLRHAGLSAS